MSRENIMNEVQARKCMEFTCDEILTPEKCRRQYRKLALQYHPDKNKTTEASVRFQEIVEAYSFLSSTTTINETGDYNSMCRSFLQTLWCETPEMNELVVSILNKMSQISVPLLQKCVASLPIHSLKKILEILEKYTDVFHVTQNITEGLRVIIQEMEWQEMANSSQPVICLYPCIDDVLDGNVYTWKYKDITYIVPLWHEEMIFECDNQEICVICCPILQENFILRGKTIHVFLTYENTAILDLLQREEVEFYLGQKRFSFRTNSLSLVKKQQFVLRHCGLPLVNKNEMLEISKRGNIVVHVTLHPPAQ